MIIKIEFLFQQVAKESFLILTSFNLAYKDNYNWNKNRSYKHIDIIIIN